MEVSFVSVAMKVVEHINIPTVAVVKVLEGWVKVVVVYVEAMVSQVEGVMLVKEWMVTAEAKMVLGAVRWV